MSVKMNEATINRPEGNRVIDAPAVIADLQQFANQLREEKAWEKNDRNAITVFKTAGLTIVLTALRQGAKMSDLVTEGVLTLQVIEGVISVDGEDGRTHIHENQVLILHPDSKQQVMAEEDSMLLLTNNSFAK